MGILSALMSILGSGRRSLENPSVSLTDPDAFLDFYGNSPSASGVRVNRKTALSLTSWWRAVNLISRDVGKIPFHVYRRVGAGKERAGDHALFQLLRYDSNEYQTANVFRAQLTGHAVSTGNGYAYIERVGMTPVALLPLDPDQVTPVRADGVLWYLWQNGATETKIPAHDILHIKGLTHDGLCGYSVLDVGRDAIGLGIAQQRYTAKTMSNGARPGVVLELPGKAQPGQIEYLRKTWEAIHTGVDNAHRTAILEGGLTAKAIAFSSVQMELLDSRKLSLVDIANLTGVPVHKVGGEGRTAYASLEQENQSYLDDALDFWLNVWENECRSKLLTEKEKADDSVVLEFLRAAMVRADLAAQAAYNRASLGGHPWETLDEARGRMNLNPVEGGDKIPEPLNFGNDGGEQNQPKDPAASNVKPKGPNSKRMERSVFNVLGDAQRRAIKRIAVHAGTAAKRSTREFGAWLDRMEGEHKDAMRGILAPAYDAWNAAYEIEDEPNLRADQFLASMREELLELSGTVKSASQLTDKIAVWAAEKERHGAADS